LGDAREPNSFRNMMDAKDISRISARNDDDSQSILKSDQESSSFQHAGYFRNNEELEHSFNNGVSSYRMRNLNAIKEVAGEDTIHYENSIPPKKPTNLNEDSEGEDGGRVNRIKRKIKSKARRGKGSEEDEEEEKEVSGKQSLDSNQDLKANIDKNLRMQE